MQRIVRKRIQKRSVYHVIHFRTRSNNNAHNDDNEENNNDSSNNNDDNDSDPFDDSFCNGWSVSRYFDWKRGPLNWIRTAENLATGDPKTLQQRERCSAIRGQQCVDSGSSSDSKFDEESRRKQGKYGEKIRFLITRCHLDIIGPVVETAAKQLSRWLKVETPSNGNSQYPFTSYWQQAFNQLAVRKKKGQDEISFRMIFRIFRKH